MLSEAYIGLGSNLGDRAANIRLGLEALRRVSRHVQASSLYETDPVGFQGQPPFLNAVCRIWTRLTAFELLAEARRAQAGASGARPFPNGPRALDIDILLYGRAVLDAPGLTIPHPRMMERLFVLSPLAEVAPWSGASGDRGDGAVGAQTNGTPSPQAPYRVRDRFSPVNRKGDYALVRGPPSPQPSPVEEEGDLRAP